MDFLNNFQTSRPHPTAQPHIMSCWFLFQATIFFCCFSEKLAAAPWLISVGGCFWQKSMLKLPWIPIKLQKTCFPPKCRIPKIPNFKWIGKYLEFLRKKKRLLWDHSSPPCSAEVIWRSQPWIVSGWRKSGKTQVLPIGRKTLHSNSLQFESLQKSNLWSLEEPPPPPAVFLISLTNVLTQKLPGWIILCRNLPTKRVTCFWEMSCRFCSPVISRRKNLPWNKSNENMVIPFTFEVGRNFGKACDLLSPLRFLPSRSSHRTLCCKFLRRNKTKL